jgi:hypothetical protein
MTARTFSMVIGVIFLAIGVLGFIPALLSAPPAHAPQVGVTAFHGYLFGLFPVNVLHNLVHIAIGVWGIAASRQMVSARTFAKALAIIYGVFAVMGLIPMLNTLFGLVPLHGHVIWLHALTAIIAAYFGWARTGEPARRTAAG